MGYKKCLFFLMVTMNGVTTSSLRCSDYTEENKRLLGANVDYLTETQERQLRQAFTLKRTQPVAFLKRISAFKASNEKAFIEEAQKRGSDFLHVQQAYYQKGHNGGCDALEGVRKSDKHTCCCSVQ